MTILQNAYNAYLTTKYEKEINEFKELALTVIDNAESELKETLYESSVILNHKERSKRVSNDLLHLIEIKKLINSTPLEIESRLFNKQYINILVNEYQKLNSLIVKGETVTIDENKYKWDLTNDGAVRKLEGEIDHGIDCCKDKLTEFVRLPQGLEVFININDSHNKEDIKKISDTIMNSLKKNKGVHI